MPAFRSRELCRLFSGKLDDSDVILDDSALAESGEGVENGLFRK